MHSFWHYCDGYYRKGLTPQQAEFATKKYKQHRRVGTVAEVLEAMCLQEERKKALANL
jgi:coenzyme F420-reducing hydrogenase delta subunit